MVIPICMFFVLNVDTTTKEKWLTLITPSTSKLATRRPEQSTLEHRSQKDGWEEKMPPVWPVKLNWQCVQVKPAVHDGGMVFSILLLAEFDERLFRWQTSFLYSSSAAPAIWGGGVRKFAGCFCKSLYLHRLPLLFQCLKTTHRGILSVQKESTSSPRKHLQQPNLIH